MINTSKMSQAIKGNYAQNQALRKRFEGHIELEMYPHSRMVHRTKARIEE